MFLCAIIIGYSFISFTLKVCFAYFITYFYLDKRSVFEHVFEWNKMGLKNMLNRNNTRKN